MKIDKIEEYDKKRCRIICDDRFSFLLYKGELHKFGLKENSIITNELYQKIICEVLSKRALARCYNLLDKRMYTVKQLRDKLYQSYYPSVAIDSAINRCVEQGFLNDSEYAYKYLSSAINKKSINIIKCELLQKGISKDTIEEVIELAGDEGVIQNTAELIRTLLLKRHFYDEAATPEKRAKEYRYLLGKGFSSSDILQEINLT